MMARSEYMESGSSPPPTVTMTMPAPLSPWFGLRNWNPFVLLGL